MRRLPATKPQLSRHWLWPKSTAVGYRKDFYPGAWMLGEWQKMGGRVIITSDAHDISSLTFGFDEAAAAIKAAGFSSVDVLTANGFETQEL